MTWEHGRVGNGNLAAPGVGRGQMPGRFGAEPHLPGQRAQGKGQRAKGKQRDGWDRHQQRASLSPFVVPLLPGNCFAYRIDWGVFFPRLDVARRPMFHTKRWIPATLERNQVLTGSNRRVLNQV